MKILLSSFNCNPYKGSEYGRGWSWVVELAARGHEVWVITEAGSQSEIEQSLSDEPIPNCHFVYHPLAPSSNAWWKFKGKQIGAFSRRFSIEWDLVIWQWQIYQKAKQLVQQIDFDCVHHVTNTCVRRYSFMGLLGLPFIIGPVSGGVKAPWALRKSYSFMSKLIELGRDLSNEFIRFNPLARLTFKTATKIYCDSSQTQALLGSFSSKSQVLFSMPPCRMSPSSEALEQRLSKTNSSGFRVMYAGRFICWKGLHLGLRAFAQLHQDFPDSRFTMIGGGPEGKRLRRLAEQLCIQQSIDWIPWLNQEELSQAYLQHDVLLFPSLHEMGGNVVLEALSHGLPTVCLDLGGPGVMVDETCGRVIKTNNLIEQDVVLALGNALTELARDPNLRLHLSRGALARKEYFVWTRAVEQVYPKSVHSTGDLSSPVSVLQD